MDENEFNLQKYDSFLNKQLFNIIALFGFLIIFLTGMFYGYTLKENEQYLTSNELKFITYINNKYTYNFIPETDTKYNGKFNDAYYSFKLSYRITNVVIIFLCIGLFLFLYGNKKSYKYENKKSLIQRIKDYYKKLKESDL